MRCRKPVSIILIAAFVELTTSCTSLRRRSANTLTPQANKYRIVRILKTSGEQVEIDQHARVWISGNEIHIGGRLRVPAAGTKVVKRDGGYAVTPVNGLTYETDAIASSGGHYVFTTKSDIVISLSEIAVVWNKETNTVLTILAVVGVIAVAAGVVTIIAALSFKNAMKGWLHWD